MHKPILVWIIFLLIIIALVIIDLGILNRKAKEISIRQSLVLSFVYISFGVIFGIWVWLYFGAKSGEEYFTGFLIEKCLSFDNIFAMSIIFSTFHIPRKKQHRILFLGIIGAIILRAIMIGIGAKLIASLSWLLYLLAIFLIGTGIKILLVEEEESTTKKQLKTTEALKSILSYLPIKKDPNNSKFYRIKTNKKTGKKQVYYSNLLLALVSIEFADIIFALDSVPAILAITNDTYVIYTSNIFAILGLRALYFTISAIIAYFHYLKYSVAVILMFIGSKIFIPDLLGIEKIPPSISLGVTLALLAIGILYSIYKVDHFKLKQK